jgi:hypothetical protein
VIVIVETEKWLNRTPKLRAHATLAGDIGLLDENNQEGIRQFDEREAAPETMVA